MGFVARLLYVCVQFRQDDQKPGCCMVVASMSKFVQQWQGRLRYRCNNCAALSAPASGSAAMRMFHLYPTVTSEHGAMPMKCKELRLFVSAPPSQWAWGVELAKPEPPELAQPENLNNKDFKFNEAESDAIWWYSGPFHGRPYEGLDTLD